MTTEPNTPPATEITREEAVAWVARRWWVGLPAKTVALAQLRQRRLCMFMDDFQTAVEEAAGCSVWTHEFVEPERLISMIEMQSGRTESPFESLDRIKSSATE